MLQDYWLSEKYSNLGHFPAKKKNSYTFFKKSHPKQVFYALLKMFYTIPVFNSYILENVFLYSFCRRFIYLSLMLLFFLFFRKIFISVHEHWCFLPFPSSLRFWYLSRAFFEALLCFFDNSYLSFLYNIYFFYYKKLLF